MSADPLPEIVQKFVDEQPDVWDAYNRLGKAVAQAGPLDPKTERLVKLAIAIGGGLEGAVRSHTRRGLAAGLTSDEVLHVAMLGITTVGWPTAFAARSWIKSEFEKNPGADR